VSVQNLLMDYGKGNVNRFSKEGKAEGRGGSQRGGTCTKFGGGAPCPKCPRTS
jgi:hypothetical protein